MNFYSNMISDAYEAKLLKNPHFSMNAFAKFIGLSPSQLNEIFKQKCGLSEGRAVEIANKLEFTKQQKKLFILSVTSEHSRSKKKREIARESLHKLLADKFLQLELETFSLISSWYNFAILELMNLSNFKPKASWLSKKLGVEIDVIRTAIQRLKRLDLIKEKNGKWSRSNGLIKTSYDKHSPAIKNYHSQLMTKAQEALHSVPIDQREFHSVYVALDPELLPELKIRLRTFLNETVDELSKNGKNKTKLAAINLQMFPIDKA